jgi:prepilin-type N-terminal cleavage/methylation domain-containing protein
MSAAPETRGNEQGFSMIELLVAMVITLIVSGAIYGLLAGGQNAFRREPELTERQQNIRMAMDVIMRDISNAGAGLPPWVQTFTSGLDACVGCPGGGSAPGPTGAVRDELEMLSTTGRDTEPVCFIPNTGNGAGTTLQLQRQGLNLPVGTVVALTFANGTWTLRKLAAPSVINETGAVPGVCTGLHTGLNFGSDAAPTMNAGTLCEPSAANTLLPALGNAPGAGTCVVTAVAFPRLVRYRIRDDEFGVPSLQRFSTDDLSGFQTIARGIEDLQIQYTTLQDSTIWVDNAPITPAPADPPLIGSWDDLTQQVRVTLSSRTESTNLQGGTGVVGGDSSKRLRGSLTSTGTPRAVLMHVAAAHPPSPMPPSPSSWYWE